MKNFAFWVAVAGVGSFTAFTPLPSTPAAIQIAGRTVVASSWKNVQLLHTLVGHTGTVEALAFSPDSQILASGGGDNDTTIRLWQPETGKQVGMAQAHQTAVRAIAITPDGKWLASCSDDTTVNIWSLKTNKFRRAFRENMSNVLSLAVTPDSQTLISGGLDGIRLWNMQQQRPIGTLVEYDNLIHSVAISPQGQLVASGDNNGVIKLWNLNTGRLIRTILGHSGTVSTMTFTPDGEILVTGSHDGTIKLWDVKSGELIRTLGLASNWVNSVAINPDGQTLASGGKDGIYLWQLSSGELIGTLSRNSDWVTKVAFSPDGQMLASGGFDKTIKIWRSGL